MKDEFDCENGKWKYAGPTIGSISFDNKGSIRSSQSGWICPKCGRIWAPWIQECVLCNLPAKKQNEKDITE